MGKETIITTYIPGTTTRSTILAFRVHCYLVIDLAARKTLEEKLHLEKLAAQLDFIHHTYRARRKPEDLANDSTNYKDQECQRIP